MLTPKEAVLDRFEQSFELFSKHFKNLFLPIFVYYFVIGAVFSLFASYFSIWYLGDQFFLDIKDVLLSSSGISNIFNLLYLNPKVILLFTLFMTFGLLFALLFIPFKLSLIKGIKQASEGENIDINNNLVWGFKNILASFRTYWYIFLYAYMLPALVFIGFGVVFIFLQKNGGDFSVLAGPFVIFMVFGVVYMFYRGLKTVFAIISAASNDDFSQENFENSVTITNGNWWRILGNIMLVSIILGVVFYFVGAILNSIISIFFSSTSQDILTNISLDSSGVNGLVDSMDFKEMMSYSFGDFLKALIDNIIKSISLVFMTIFLYLFFVRLKIEANIKTSSKKEL